MADDGRQPTCFVIMPITTPKHAIELYDGDADHFRHVLENLFGPALEDLGYDVIPPSTSGGDVIQASIIRNLDEADLVLCDMSQLNANVFFELGIRTALDKPVCAVVDDVTGTVPFDTSIVHSHQYRASLQSWVVREEIPRLAEHISASSTDRRNSMWRVFGVEAGVGRASVNPADAATDAKLDLILRRLDTQRSAGRAMPTATPLTASQASAWDRYLESQLPVDSAWSYDGDAHIVRIDVVGEPDPGYNLWAAWYMMNWSFTPHGWSVEPQFPPVLPSGAARPT